MESSREIERQAVIIVHGMGEQRPMETLRSFVRGVKSELEKSNVNEKRAVLRSQPDSIGDIYETTKYNLSQIGDRPNTDFYEFYWAHNMRDTHISEMTSWIYRLMFTWVRRIPERLYSIWFTIWALVITAVIIALLLGLKHFDLSLGKGIFAALLSGAGAQFVISTVLSFVNTAFLKLMGDAARYFTPEPDNIMERSHIRQQGILFLEKLHKISTRAKPDRIIIVAHSLGSVIAYDLMRLLWTEYNTIYKPGLEVNQEKLEEINKYATGKVELNNEKLEDYQKLQYECWMEQRNLGNPWLISDFISLGAPLNAIDYFMVTNETITELQKQRELPANPPIPDEVDHNIFYSSTFRYDVQGKLRSVKWLNHGAMFGLIRCTNIFYTSDFFGGNMQRIFGKGVKDITKKRKSIWFYPGGHTRYWEKEDKNNVLKEIVEALKLDRVLSTSNKNK